MREADRHALRLARQSWQFAVPTEREVETAVVRLSPGLRRVPAAPRRRAAFALALLLFMAGVAWADIKMQDLSRRPPRLERSTPALQQLGEGVLGGLRHTALPVMKPFPADGRQSQGGSEAEQHASPPPGPVTPGFWGVAKETESAPKAAATPDASWRAVRRALARGDREAVVRSLAALRDEEDADTRAKAQVGLAQLAQAQGDCERARLLAEQVLAGQASPDQRRRAQRILAACR